MSVEAEALPAILQHMALAIYKKKGSGEKAFVAAMNIARWSLVKNGYCTPPSETGSLERVKLTTKGQKRNAEHVKDKDHVRTVAQFRKLYLQHRAAYELVSAEPRASTATRTAVAKTKSEGTHETRRGTGAAR